MKQFSFAWLLISAFVTVSAAEPPASIKPFFAPPPEFASDFGHYKSPLKFENGEMVKSAEDWQRRRKEIRAYWDKMLGTWPALIEKPNIEVLESKPRENFLQQKIRIEVAPQLTVVGYLLLPTNSARLPGVVIPFYEPETSIGLGKKELDFGYQLTKRGFVTLSIGSPGGDARKPDRSGAQCQPLSFLGYIAANCCNALANMKEVDPSRIGIVGHSYGGKWALFGSCLYEKFACAVWCDPGIVFDETRPNVNYWEPWYLGYDPETARKPGVPTKDNPRTGPYKVVYESGHDLHEVHALMAPRPFLVSGGSEDPPERWRALNHSVAANKLLGYANRVAMTNRKTHTPTPESNEQIYAFFEYWLQRAGN